MADEYTSLNGSSTSAGGSTSEWVPSSKKVITILGTLQVALIAFFYTCTTFDIEDYKPAEYVIFRDIMVMLLLGFGFLMTFLKKYGLGAVGFTMMLTVFAVQLNIAVELFTRILHHEWGSEDTIIPLPISMATIIDGEFSAATLLISFGAIIGRATPLQLIIMTISQSFFYAFNKVCIVFGFVGAEDVGGTMTIHMFGAYFGLAVSYALRGKKESSEKNESSNHVSDVMAMIGTTLLWVYWPSFVGATESAKLENEKLCVMNTIMALLGSTGATFFVSQQLSHGMLDPVHIANATLAGGVAIGSSARINIGPGSALLLGAVAGVISTYGYAYSSPLLDKFGIYDTCGVANLHGYPSLLGGLISILFVAMHSDAQFLEKHNVAVLMTKQALGVGITFVLACLTGLVTGVVMSKASPRELPDEYYDGVWWEGDYFTREYAARE